MKKIIFFAIILTMIACEKNEVTVDPNAPNATLFQQVKESSDADTTTIRFVFALKGNSDITGKCICYPYNDSTLNNSKTISEGYYLRFTSNPLWYKFTTSPSLYIKRNKTVISFEADSVGENLYRVKVTFPDTIAIINSKSVSLEDTLIYHATKKKILYNF